MELVHQQAYCSSKFNFKLLKSNNLQFIVLKIREMWIFEKLAFAGCNFAKYGIIYAQNLQAETNWTRLICYRIQFCSAKLVNEHYYVGVRGLQETPIVLVLFYK